MPSSRRARATCRSAGWKFTAKQKVIPASAATWTTRSTKNELHLEICNNCHPFFTGRQKLIDTEGRVERFTKRFGAQTSESRKAAAKVARSAAIRKTQH